MAEPTEARLLPLGHAFIATPGCDGDCTQSNCAGTPDLEECLTCGQLRDAHEPPAQVRARARGSSWSSMGKHDLLEAARAVRSRIAFIGMPQEPMWSPDDSPCTEVPDWRKEIKLLDAAIAAEEARLLPLGHAFVSCADVDGACKIVGCHFDGCGQPRAAHEPAKPAPVAWHTLCASGDIHGWADSAERAEYSRETADRYGECGPHRVVPLYTEPRASRGPMEPEVARG